jgi:hypothetical protein
MPLSRYKHIDEYTSAELKLLFENGDAEFRLALLRRLQRKGPLPEVIVQLASTDNDPRVRHKLAVHKGELSREIIERLRRDPELAIRAAVCESRSFLPRLFDDMQGQIEILNSLTPIERLALMRNPGIREGLAEKIFDHEDSELGLSERERCQLITNYLANTGAFRPERLDTDFYLKAGITASDAYAIVSDNKKHYEHLWRIARKWDWWALRGDVYATAPVSDNLKAETYKQEQNEWARLCLVRACTATDIKTLKAATEDKDYVVSRLAFEKLALSGHSDDKKANALSYTWTAITGLIEIAIALLLLNSEESRSGKLTISLVLMTYIAVRVSASALGRTAWEESFAGLARYVHTLKLLRDPGYKKERQSFDEAVAAAAQKLQKGKVTVLIRAVALDIVGICAMIYLVKTIFQP